MRNMRVKRFFALSLMSVLVVSPSHAFFGMGDVVHDPIHMGKTVAAEIARAADAARQIQTEIYQYERMVRDAVSLADPVFKPVGDTFRSLYSLYTQGQSLRYRLENIDSMFYTMNPSYYTYLSTMGQGRPTREAMRERYEQWSNKGYENTKSALEMAGMVVNRAETEEQMLQRLIAQSNSAGGHLEAMQAGNQIAGNLSRQMEGLSQIAAQNVRLQAEFMAWQVERQTHADAFSTHYRNVPVQEGSRRGF